jgi:alpha-L-fucosidase
MMQDWFEDAKLGIFIHWGIYSVEGVGESWSFWRGEIPYDDYMAQMDGFTASRYDCEAWAELFAHAGAKYAVLTTKHHDGVALFDTKLSDLSVVKKTPAGRDLVRPYCEAMRKAGLEVGLYFSHLDWSHPDYASLPPANPELVNLFTYKGKEDREAWQRFLAFHRGQLAELCTQYGKIDLLWFDGDWERTAEDWKTDELVGQLHEWQPDCILNSRFSGYDGDYATPEQGVPVKAPDRPWELCMTINDSWGYRNLQPDTNWKSTRQVVRVFCDCISMGGNLLLDVGPMEDGTIPREAVSVLEELGDWLGPRKEAIHGTRAGLPIGHFLGGSTLSKDRRSLYLFLYHKPWDQVAVKGIKNKVKCISVLGSGKELSGRKIGGADWTDIPGYLWIDVPEDVLHPLATVIKMELEGELDLYQGDGVELSSQ